MKKVESLSYQGYYIISMISLKSGLKKYIQLSLIVDITNNIIGSRECLLLPVILTFQEFDIVDK